MGPVLILSDELPLIVRPNKTRNPIFEKKSFFKAIEEGKKEIVLEDKPNMIGDEVKKIIAIFLKLLVAIILIRLIWYLPKMFSNSSNKSGIKAAKPPSVPKKI